MSDPPKKPMSLKDRIAAFENKGGSSGPPAPAPVPRPRPAGGGVSWKPKAPSPPDSPRVSTSDDGEKKSAGLSAADAKESIGRGGSLRDRMAALQGLSGFGGGAPSAVPPPRPAGEKPKWKPPPKPIATADDDQPDLSASVAAAAAAHISPPPVSSPERHEGAQAVDDDAEAAEHAAPTDATEDAPEGQEQEPDPEEEERQRRAAIAARMARLGGTRVGMAPPIFGKKPEIKKPEAPKEEAKPDTTEDVAPAEGMRHFSTSLCSD